MSRVWFITGASRGLGAAIAARARAAGDEVVATSRTTGCDVTQEAQARDAVAAAIAGFGRIDVLVHSAGCGLIGAVEEASAGEVERSFATNVFGLLNVTRAVLPHMRARRRGRVIHVASGIGAMGFGIFAATKRASEAISEAMSLELEPLGIHTTVVSPGHFRTGFLASAARSAPIDDYAPTAGAVRTFARGAEGQQPGDPRRLAEAVISLAGMATPPRLLALGTDASRKLEDRAVAELAAWRAHSVPTGFVE